MIFGHASLLTSATFSFIQNCAQSISPEKKTRTFSDLISKSGEIVEDVTELLKEQPDFEWSSVTEQRIRDFVQLHELRNEVELRRVSCKSTMCEISGYEYKLFAWETILMNLREQDWWEFHTGQTVSDKDQENNEFFYFIARL